MPFSPNLNLSLCGRRAVGMVESIQALPKSKVLIVDDIKSNRISLASILDDLDVDVVDVDSGEAALATMLHHEFSVILIDVSMPVMDGYETASLIHGNNKFINVPIVMLTAYDDNNYLRAYESGAVDFIRTPVEPLVLINKVKQFVELDKLRRLALLSTEEALRSKEAALAAHREVKEFAERLNLLIESTGEGVIGVDSEGFITFVNPKSTILLKLDKAALIGRHVLEYVSINKVIKAIDVGQLLETRSYDSDVEQVLSFIHESEQAEYQEPWIDSQGRSFHSRFSCDLTYDKKNEYNGAVIVFQDVTKQKKMDDKMQYLASFDPLTQIANRFYFQDALGKAVARCKRSRETVGLLFLDLDHFKYVNDQLGHDAGDQLLQTISQRIKSVIRKGDLLARIGGDEFAVILHEIKNNDQASKIAAKILREISSPITILGQLVDSSASIGISILDESIETAEALVQTADTAMYAAKKKGRNNFQFFEKEMQKREEKNTRIQLALKNAILNDEFNLVYQAKMSFVENRVFGCEVLLRWSQGTSKPMDPVEFIPVAENSGQIIEIGTWVFRTAFEQLANWTKEGKFLNSVMSINVSTLQLTNRSFTKKLADLLLEFNIDPKLIELEITEACVANDFKVANNVLSSLHELGVAISIDDFGTGYSSLDHLRKLPIDVIKIDQRFIGDIGVNKKNEELVLAMLAASKAMGIRVIAECVETQEQLDYLLNSGCELIQGNLISEPLDSDNFERFLANQHSQLLENKTLSPDQALKPN